MILETIIQDKKEEIKELKKKLPEHKLKEEVQESLHYPALELLFENSPVFFCEIKFASPSEGDIAIDKDLLEVAKSYLESGASALSILTESKYFKGQYEYLSQLRKVYPEAFLFNKDFIVDPYQVYLAKKLGANGFLLIADALESEELNSLVDLGLELGLSPLVEVHDRDALEKAHQTKAKIIGVNNRNLKNMKVDLKTSKEMSSFFKLDRFYISESGLKYPEELQEIYTWGYQGFLIGSSLMKEQSPGKAFEKLRASCK